MQPLLDRVPDFVHADLSHAILFAAETVGVETGPAVDILVKRAMPLPPRPPDNRIRGTEEADHRNMKSTAASS